MLAAYVIEAFMATVYLTAKVLPMISQGTTTPILKQRPRVKWSLPDIKYRFLQAVLFSMDDFMDTATLFCFTIIVAGMITIPATKKPYDMLQAILVTAFSISVILGMHPEFSYVAREISDYRIIGLRKDLAFI